MDPTVAKQRLWLLDSKGLLTESRTDLTREKREFAASAEQLEKVGLSEDDVATLGLLRVVQAVKPAALVGAAAKPDTFDEEVLLALLEVRNTVLCYAMLCCL